MYRNNTQKQGDIESRSDGHKKLGSDSVLADQCAQRKHQITTYNKILTSRHRDSNNNLIYLGN